MTQQQEKIREAVGIFDDYDRMEKAIEILEEEGFGRHQISVLGSEAALKERFGTEQVSTQRLKDHPDAPRSPDIKREELAIGQGVLIGGGLFTGVAAAVIAAGGMAAPGLVTAAVLGGAGGSAVGAVLARLLGEKYAAFFQQQIEEGGLLLWVNTPDPAMEAKAQAILKEYGARDVHVHDLPADGNENESDRAAASPGVATTVHKLNLVMEEHQFLLSCDPMMRSKVANLHDSLCHTAKEGDHASAEQVRAIDVKIDDAVSYAQDMAEEEQRLIAETQAEGNGTQERESERYFALAHDLNAFAAEYRHDMAYAAAA